ncbi:MAG: DNA polymerase III subunit delta' [Ahrensia sp.]|nr:DNA polymerase III subunit delta' [Ahrensia sp.]
MIEEDERPVADRLDGIATPAESDFLVGHDAARQAFLESWASQRLHHAWLLSGPRGIGKATLAFHLAKRLLSGRTDAASGIDTRVLGQIAQGAHPGLLHLTRPWDSKTKRFKTQLSVDEIRRTQSFYGLTSASGGWRICIIDSADEMNASAANALLKILEEPPKRSLFFVISHASGAILPTIRSRCQALALSPLSEAQVVSVLQSLEVEASRNRIEQAAALSGGSARQALQVLQGGTLKAWQAFEQLGHAKGEAGDWVAAHKLADQLVAKGQEDAFWQFLDMVSGWIAEQPRGGDDRRLAVLAGWADVWEKTAQSIRLADAYNLDRKQVILTLFSNLFAHNARRM